MSVRGRWGSMRHTGILRRRGHMFVADCLFRVTMRLQSQKGSLMKRLLLSTLLFLSALLYAQRPAQAPVPAPAPVTATAPASEDVRQILADRIDTYKKSVGIVVGASSPQGTKVYSYGRLASGSQT